MLGDRAYDAQKIRRRMRARRILPLLAMRNTRHGSGLGCWRWVVERTFAWLNQFRRLRVRYEKARGYTYRISVARVHTDLLEKTAAFAPLIRCLQHELEPIEPLVFHQAFRWICIPNARGKVAGVGCHEIECHSL